MLLILGQISLDNTQVFYVEEKRETWCFLHTLVQRDEVVYKYILNVDIRMQVSRELDESPLEIKSTKAIKH